MSQEFIILTAALNRKNNLNFPDHKTDVQISEEKRKISEFLHSGISKLLHILFSECNKRIHIVLTICTV